MPLYYFECDMGCGIREAKDISQARSNILKEAGTFNADHGLCRKAREEDIQWVKAMGGFVPKMEPVKGGGKMKQKTITVRKELKCTKCDEKRVIHRKASRNKKNGHIKHIWCPCCKKRTKHRELPRFDSRGS